MSGREIALGVQSMIDVERKQSAKQAHLQMVVMPPRLKTPVTMPVQGWEAWNRWVPDSAPRRWSDQAAMMRRSTRRDPGSVFEALPTDIEQDAIDGVIPAPDCVIKREGETGIYAAVRQQCSTQGVEAAALRACAARWLESQDQTIERDSESSREVSALGPNTVRLPPRALQCGSEEQNALLVEAVNDCIDRRNWHELWVLMQQIAGWFGSCHQLPPVRPWWMRNVSAEDVVEAVDIAARDEPGGMDAPVALSDSPAKRFISIKKEQGTEELSEKQEELSEEQEELAEQQELENDVKERRARGARGWRIVDKDGKTITSDQQLAVWELAEEAKNLPNSTSSLTTVIEEADWQGFDDSIEVIKTLLRNGTDPGRCFGGEESWMESEYSDDCPDPPLLRAIVCKRPSSERLEIVRALLEAGATADLCYSSESSPFATALSLAVQKTLQDNGFIQHSDGTMEKMDPDGRTHRDNVEIVRLICDHGGNCHYWGVEEGQPICQAAEAGDTDLARVLLEGPEYVDGTYGATGECLSVAGKCSFTPMELALERLDRSMNPADGEMIAKLSRCAEMIALLAEHGASIDDDDLRIVERVLSRKITLPSQKNSHKRFRPSF